MSSFATANNNNHNMNMNGIAPVDLVGCEPHAHDVSRQHNNNAGSHMYNHDHHVMMPHPAGDGMQYSMDHHQYQHHTSEWWNNTCHSNSAEDMLSEHSSHSIPSAAAGGGDMGYPQFSAHRSDVTDTASIGGGSFTCSRSNTPPPTSKNFPTAGGYGDGHHHGGAFSNPQFTSSTGSASAFSVNDGLSSVESVQDTNSTIGGGAILAPPTAMDCCVTCGRQCNTAHSLFCSKRCEWSASCQCPQCGRKKRHPHETFCSIICASQATQANWCSVCGVCQTMPGTSYCSARCADTAMSYAQPTLLPRRQTVLHNQRRVHHTLAPEDRTCNALSNMFNNALAATDNTKDKKSNKKTKREVVAVVRITSDTIKRKAYLSYRGAVEQQITGIPASQKYGHGGEGNEQKRFFPVSVSCPLVSGGLVESSSSLVNGYNQQPNAGRGNCDRRQHHQGFGRGGTFHRNANGNKQDITGPPVQLCNNPECEACAILSNGALSLGATGCASHYCTTSAAAALPWAMHVASLNSNDVDKDQQQEVPKLYGVIQARAVIGNAELLSDPSQVTIPDDLSTTHSCVVTNGDQQQDGTYLFRDDAIDPQYLILFK